MPWGANYYRNTAVFSDDQGKTWNRTSVISDDPLIGDSGSALGQPSRMIFSEDFDKPVLAPIYAHRASVHPLQSDKLLVSYRNAWGTTGSRVFAFDEVRLTAEFGV
jgi:hypothetical protein